jgi:hypothetical protein
MTTHEFDLLIDRSPTDEELDALFETDQGSSTPEYGGPEPPLVHVHRDAEALSVAIASAVRDVESTGLAVVGVASQDPVTLREIAVRTGRTHESVRLLAAGKRGPGRFPVPESSGTWSLYSWVLVSEWFADHYGGEAVGRFDREIAAADHLMRARHMLAGDEDRESFAGLVTA